MRPPTLEELALIRNVARSFARSYPRIDGEDIEQTLTLRWYERFHTFHKYLDMPETDRRPLLIRTFQTWGIQYCRAELVEYHKLHPKSDDAYFYSRTLIMRMLPFVEDPIAWSNMARLGDDDGQPRGKNDPALGGDALAHYADLRIAWDQLSEAERTVLRFRYVDGVDYAIIADTLNILESSARKRVERAVSAMQRLMGCDSRSRKVMSNAKAQVVTRREYEGE